MGGPEGRPLRMLRFLYRAEFCRLRALVCEQRFQEDVLLELRVPRLFLLR